ncbi:MAG: hypothetical protein JXN62_01425 [Bacteroidales bacterium]|nr:hypothetical protein [Bacteroidales bacterium]
MRKLNIIVLLVWFILPSCEKDDSFDNSGTITINNDLILSQDQGYINYGFLFSEAKIASNVSSPKPDITVDNDGTLDNLILQGKINTGFFKAGEYADETLAKQEFSNLKSLTITEWEDWAFSIKPNQIWIIRTSEEFYAKIRIISTVSETRGTRYYAECTFQWVYQPDGTLTFPVK